MRNTLFLALGISSGIAAAAFLRRAKLDLAGKVVFITGGSRGLGLLLAKAFARGGARVAICARDSEELIKAKELLSGLTNDVLTIEADMTMREEAELAIEKIQRALGPIDVLVNNAGVISVGPLESTTIDDYRSSINTHFWGPYFATMAVLPQMRRRRRGRIVNISSIGGKISVPHLLPYSVGKFALTGFSEGLRSELRKDNILVTTVCPGLMRTGSPRNALFKGQNEAEYAWFSVSDSLPVFSMNAERAARKIVSATQYGCAELVLSLPAKVAVKLHGVAPGLTGEMLGIANWLLPGPGGIGTGIRTGQQSSSEISPSWITALNERAAKQNNEVI
ncbi:MAG TPA: SDR family NAD(P)-dependent oxidoreductase [Terriglobales bacterium]|jgi:NAD(P)-dependent dehydrogenase (short-subunit alcohol dehydrogenase family)|nr:SDR family NAD(P)-dependent oxidoreductase [Terriglobales bacterium]